jgi:hypothetical protein
MKVKYELTKREKDFLIALNEKTKGQKNGWSGMMDDDKFRKKWKNEIEIFHENNLTKKVDGGYGFWRYSLNETGLNLQKELLEKL